MNMREDDPYDVCPMIAVHGCAECPLADQCKRKEKESTRETYVLPIKVEIQSEEPDVTMREIAEAIYDTVSAWSSANIEPHPGRTLDVQWSIYKKPDPKSFGQKVIVK